ncbi:hypothetical protein SAMN05660865_00834 [Caloramator fervidus]|uniref:Uncharacterized protein n=1 Tax=Caloramator fervidus TaxID=29344 RepID=A0A1H5U983_9CLOT|nr:hypothetical protein [Caloramator fervidus]SEF71583.1 hypothetical protein SAMN05660865_00834 [Caloramator fervidus]
MSELEKTEMAFKLYRLSIKLQDRIPKVLVEFSKKICNDYIKIAKENEIKGDMKNIFK